MPVYEPKDYEKVIKRIQQKIIANNIKMGECLSEEAITEFEKYCNIRLPEAYRMFLKRVGNGCDDCCLNRLEDIERKDLSHPFMLQDFWLWEEVPQLI